MGELETAGDFSVILDFHFWKLLKNDDDYERRGQVITIVLEHFKIIFHKSGPGNK